MDVVLVRPEIATNTGNIIRLCANTGVGLHLVEPLGFVLDDARLRRAGLDYHEFAQVRAHPSLRTCAAALVGRRRFGFSSRARDCFDAVAFAPDDVLVFGSERAGLEPDDMETLAFDAVLRIPMRPGNRSMNLANAVAVVVYEAWRQHDFVGASGVSSVAVASGGLTSETLTSGRFDG